MKFNKILLITIFISSTNIFSNNIHPNFSITSLQLENLILHEDKTIKNKINESSFIFLDLINKIISKKYLILVDKEHKLQNTDVPADLVNLTDYEFNTRYKIMYFSKVALDDFILMNNAALKDNIDLFIASTYRSYEFQEQIFKNMKNFHGEEKAATIVAYPGSSQHQLGTAVDFGTITPSYAYTDAGKWLLENSWKYGFTISYPRGKETITTYMWEPWHYRYIGKDAAILQKKYFDDVQHLLLVFWNKYGNYFRENHKVLLQQE